MALRGTVHNPILDVRAPMMHIVDGHEGKQVKSEAVGAADGGD